MKNILLSMDFSFSPKHHFTPTLSPTSWRRGRSRSSVGRRNSGPIVHVAAPEDGRGPIRGFAARIVRGIVFLLLVALIAPLARAKLNVVATTADLGSIAKVIGGDRIDLSTLGKPT